MSDKASCCLLSHFIPKPSEKVVVFNPFKKVSLLKFITFWQPVKDLDFVFTAKNLAGSVPLTRGWEENSLYTVIQ